MVYTSIHRAALNPGRSFKINTNMMPLICRSKRYACHRGAALCGRSGLRTVNAQDFFFLGLIFVSNQASSPYFFFSNGSPQPPMCVCKGEEKQRAAKPALSAWQMIFRSLDLINPPKCDISTIGWQSFSLCNDEARLQDL